MSSNKIEQIIGDIEEYIDGCKMQAFSNTKIVVDRPQLESFLDDLRQYTPEEVKKYQRLINNRDKILAEAKKKAAETEQRAQAYAEQMTSESQITKLAYDKASEILQQANDEAARIVDEATEESNQIRQAALAYTNEILNNLQSIIGGTIEDTHSRFEAMFSSLNDHLNIVQQNQRELNSENSASQENEEQDNDLQPFFETATNFPDDDEDEDEDED